MESINKIETIDDQRVIDSAISGFMTKVYGWMGLALLVTALMAWYVAHSEAAISFIFGNSAVFYGLIIAELVLVFTVSAAINKLSVTAASILFIVYSLVNGATLSVIFLVYTSESIATTFCITGATFGAMSLYGLLTKKDLSGWGNLLFMALIGLIIATIVNIIWANSALYWITTYAGILIFVGLTAYDTQKLKNLSLRIEGDSTAAMKYSILGALTLYLDFINLFLYLLRLFGRRK